MLLENDRGTRPFRPDQRFRRSEPYGWEMTYAETVGERWAARARRVVALRPRVRDCVRRQYQPYQVRLP